MTIDQRNHVDTKGVLQLGLLVQIVQDNFWHFAALELDDQAHTGLVALVLNVADAFNLLFMDQFGHAFLKRLFVDLVGQLINDDGLALALVDVLKVAFGAHDNLASPGAIAVLYAIDAVNNTGGWKVWRRDDFHQFINAGLRISQQVQATINHLVHVVRRYVGGHAHRNTRRPIDQ